MFANAVRFVAPAAARSFSATARAEHKVAVMGAAGGIGQPLSMLIKQMPGVTQLACYDIVHAKGVASDLSHMCTPAQVTGHVGPDELKDCLTGADIVVIPAGVPRKPGMTRDDLFNTNASIVANLSKAVASFCPKAMVLIISNPVNSTVPIAAEILKKAGVYDPKRLFGVTTLDIVRAETFIAEKKGLDVSKVSIPVIGGHAGTTILPLLSRTGPTVNFSQEELEALDVRIQNGGTEVVKAKDGAGSATLSMAYAGARFTKNILDGLNGKGEVVYAYVQSDITAAKFFSSAITLGPNGVEQFHPLGQLTAYEQKRLDEGVVPELQGSIAKGEKFAKDF